MITPETEYCTIAEAALLLHESRPTVWRMVKSGRLPAYRIGRRSIRIRRTDLGRVVEPASERQWPADIPGLQVISQGDSTISADELIAKLRALREELLERRGGRPFSSSVPLIRECGGDERPAQTSSFAGTDGRRCPSPAGGVRRDPD